MHFNNLKKAQGTIEYVIILAVIISISLVIVTLFINVFQVGVQNPTLSSIQDKQYWSTQTIALSDAIVDANGDAVFVLTNNSDYTLRMTGYKIDGNIFNIAENKITFKPREQKSIFFPEIGKCTTSKGCAYNEILFYYAPMNETQILTSGGEALVLGKKDNVAWNFEGTNNMVCVAQGEVLQTCSAGGGGGSSFDQDLNTTASPSFVKVSTNDGTRTTALSDGTYAINSTGPNHFLNGVTDVEITNGSNALQWDVPNFWGGNLAGSGGSAYFYDNGGRSVYIADGTYAINAVGQNHFTDGGSI